ncbi:DUF5710 domain-containing protein [Cupriavidus sp. CP313]
MGARWDGQARKWFIPPNLPHGAVRTQWLPAGFRQQESASYFWYEI